MPSLDLGPVVGPQGEQGATGAQGIRGEQGLPGPNQVTNSTATPLTGVLTGNGSVVGVVNIDAEPTADSTGFAQSGGTDKAIKARVPVIGMGNNLLRNWYFGNPVNQRGQSSYSGQKYGIDGWKTAGDNSAVITINGGSITFAPSQSQSYFVQGLMDYVIPLGRTATISALIDGDLWATSFAIPSTRPEANAVIGRYNKGNDGYIALVTDANADYQFQMWSPGITRTLYAFKLELGSEQTLCHNEGTAEAPVWVLNEIPDYEYELYRCITSTADSSDTYANKTLATDDDVSVVPITVTPTSNVDTSTIAFSNSSYRVGRQVFINVAFAPAIARIQAQSFCSIPSAVCPAQNIAIFANVVMRRTAASKTLPAIAIVYSSGYIGFPNQGGYDETNNLTNDALIYIQGTYYI